MEALGGTHRQVCAVLDHKAEDETARNMQRLSLEALGVMADEPWKNRETPPVVPPVIPPVVPETRAAPPADVIRAERERITAIRTTAGTDADEAFIQRAIDENWTLERTNAEVLTLIRQHRAPAVGGIHSRSRETDVNARSLAAGFLATDGMDPTKHSMHPGTRDPGRADRLTEQDADRGDQFRGLSYYDIVRECVRLDTGRIPRSVDDAIDSLRASTSGATLSYVFTTNIYARLLAGWESMGDTTSGWCDEEDVPNFMTQEDISLAATADLERLPAGDTAKHATASDSREQYSIARYAKQFVVDEQNLIDDRLGAIMRMPFELGQAARRLRPDLVYSLLLQNPTMLDTGAVFNATAVTTAGGHANLGTTALSSDGLKAAITAMVSQRLNRTSDMPGQQLNIRPRFLIVPAALEWTGRALTASAMLAKLFADSSDPWYSQLNLIAQEGLRLVVDDRIGAIGVWDPKNKTARTGLDTNWFLAEGGSRGLRVAYRRGTGRAPSLRSFQLSEGQWGVGWDIKHDIGAAFTEYRTWYESTGAGA